MLLVIQKLSKFTSLCKCSNCQSEYTCNHYAAKKSRIGHLCNDCKNVVTNMIEFTQQDLLNVFDYDEATGNLTSKVDTTRYSKNDLVTYKNTVGYLIVVIGRKEYLAHRIIWFIKTGSFPLGQIDHIDHVRDNNSWNNLREVEPRDQQLNMGLHTNNTSGVMGVRQLKSGKFYAYIMVNRKQISLGSYITLDEAKAARQVAEAKYGFHVNHGK